jgi:hypothetical protein
MATYIYEREWVAAKGHWDTDYPSKTDSLVQSVASALGKTPVLRCSGDECRLVFDEEITPEEKATLDAVVAAFKVAAQTADKWVYKSRVQITTEILHACEPTVQLPRCMAALDKNATFIAALDNDNWALARSRLMVALAGGEITQEDYDMIDAIMPE